MNKLIVTDYEEFDITGGISIDDFLSKFKEVISKVLCEYEQVSDFKIQCARDDGYYRLDGEGYQSILVYFNRLETDEEFETRKNQQKWIKENATNSLKKLIDNNKEEAVKYIKELGLI